MVNAKAGTNASFKIAFKNIDNCHFKKRYSKFSEKNLIRTFENWLNGHLLGKEKNPLGIFFKEIMFIL